MYKRRTREQADICYLMTAPLLPGYVKIGCVNGTANLETRLHNLEQGCPGGLKLSWYTHGLPGDGYALEQRLLELFSSRRLGDSEWLKADVREVARAAN